MAAYPESAKILTGKSSIRKTQISGIILTYSITNYLRMIGIIDVVFIIGGKSVLGLGAVHSQITHLRRGAGGSNKSLFCKMGDKVKGGAKNLKKWVTSFMDGPLLVG